MQIRDCIVSIVFMFIYTVNPEIIMVAAFTASVS